MPKDSFLALKVGVFVIAALAALTVFILSVSDFALFRRGRNIEVIFDFASGLRKSAPVRVAGVEAGLVRDIELFFDPVENKTRVRAELWMGEETVVPADSTVLINHLGLLGEKYVEIVPGVNRQKFWRDGQKVRGRDPIMQEEISHKVISVAEQVESGVKGINELIFDAENRGSIRSTLKHLSSVTERFDRLAAQVESGDGTIGRLLYDNRLYDDLEGFAADVKENPWKLLYRPKTAK